VNGLNSATSYAELHCHSNYSFQEGASSIEEILTQAAGLGYAALALTDHDNLCGAMEFAQSARVVSLKAVTGAEITLAGSKTPLSRPPSQQGRENPPTGLHHLTLLAATPRGYSNLSRLLSYARVGPDPEHPPEDLRRDPVLDPALLKDHAEGLVALSGCRQGEIPTLIAAGRLREAEAATRTYLDWFDPGSFYLELQHNLV
jgi:error-prone DNA polymerase